MNTNFNSSFKPIQFSGLSRKPGAITLAMLLTAGLSAACGNNKDRFEKKETPPATQSQPAPRPTEPPAVAVTPEPEVPEVPPEPTIFDRLEEHRIQVLKGTQRAAVSTTYTLKPGLSLSGKELLEIINAFDEKRESVWESSLHSLFRIHSSDTTALRNAVARLVRAELLNNDDTDPGNWIVSVSEAGQEALDTQVETQESALFKRYETARISAQRTYLTKKYEFSAGFLMTGQEILDILEEKSEEKDILALFPPNADQARMREVLAELVEAGLVWRSEQEPDTEGDPKVVFYNHTNDVPDLADKEG